MAAAFATKAAIRFRSRIRRAVSKSIVGAGGNANSSFAGGGVIRISHGYATPGERCGERRFEFGDESRCESCNAFRACAWQFGIGIAALMNLALAATSARVVSLADLSLILPRLLCLPDRFDAAVVDRFDAAAAALCCAAAVAVFSLSLGCLSFRCLERSVPLPASAIAATTRTLHSAASSYCSQAWEWPARARSQNLGNANPHALCRQKGLMRFRKKPEVGKV